jgi:hypothetical protein
MRKHVFITRPKIQNIYNSFYATFMQRACDVPQATGTKHHTLLRARVYVCVQQTCDNVTQAIRVTTGRPVPNQHSRLRASPCVSLMFGAPRAL